MSVTQRPVPVNVFVNNLRRIESNPYGWTRVQEEHLQAAVSRTTDTVEVTSILGAKEIAADVDGYVYKR